MLKSNFKRRITNRCVFFRLLRHVYHEIEHIRLLAEKDTKKFFTTDRIKINIFSIILNAVETKILYTKSIWNLGIGFITLYIGILSTENIFLKFYNNEKNHM